MKATTINVAASHLVMISHPKEVAELIEQATMSVASVAKPQGSCSSGSPR